MACPTLRGMPYPGLARRLAPCGAIGAVLFVVVFLVDGALHPDYDPVRDTVSELALGAGGWVQVTNFVVTGLLMVAFAVALAWTLRSGRCYHWAPRLFAAYGVGLVLSGIFRTDPGPSATTTGHGDLHLAAGVLVFGSLTAACFVLARRFPDRRWAWYSRATGIAVPVLFLAMGAGPPSIMGLLQRACIVVGWGWVAVISIRAWSSNRHPRPVVRADADDPEWD
jgi:hypothetical membrane protein